MYYGVFGRVFSRWLSCVSNVPLVVNVTGTKYEYIGVGYKLLDGYPEEKHDPGLLLDKRVLQV